MSDSDTPPPIASLPPSASLPPLTPAPARRMGGVIVLLFVIAAAIIAALLWWQTERRVDNEHQIAAWADARVRLESRINDLQATLETTQRTLRALETRASDNAATNTVLREELLGMGERATLLEETVARLADTRVRGEMILRLNEAEFLLLMGEERLRLFGDADSAVQAFTLADAALSGLDDPVLANLRQTLAQELLALRAIPDDVRPALRAELARLGEDLGRFPASRSGAVQAADANDSRLVRLLSQLVTVRRVDPQASLVGPAQREAALAALRLQFDQAQAALARPDPDAFVHALQQAGLGVARLFDAQDPDVVRLQAVLERLRATRLVPELPVLGATLRELRGLRATRSFTAQSSAITPPEPEIAPPLAEETDAVPEAASVPEPEPAAPDEDAE